MPGVPTDVGSASIDVPTLEWGDAGADASIGDDTIDETSETPATSEPTETGDASVTEATSAPVVTSDATPVSSDEADTSAPAASSSAEGTSDSPYGPNLITNPGFEDGNTAGWTPFGTGTLSASTTYAKTGTYSGRTTGRAATWNGLGFDLLATASPGATYHVEASVLTAAATDTLKLTFTINCTAVQGDASYLTAASGAANNTTWVTLSGDTTLPSCPDEAMQLTFYVEGTTGTADIYIDDVSVREVL